MHPKSFVSNFWGALHHSHAGFFAIFFISRHYAYAGSKPGFAQSINPPRR